MAEALLGLGGNVGDVRSTLDRAITLLCADGAVKLLARSSDYQTPPWGVTEQPAFVNLCVRVETAFAPTALLQRVLAVEAALGRHRAAETRWGPRTIDIDILAYDEIRLDEANLQLPHPRLKERAFVLVPLAEIAPDWRIDGEIVGELAARADQAGITRLAPLFHDESGS